MRYFGVTRLAIIGWLVSGSLRLCAQGVPPNEQARFLAGMPAPMLRAQAQAGPYKEHAAVLSKAWAAKNASLGKTRAWAQAQGTAQSGAPVFYFFSGPDFLYAQSFFPNAPTYILCGQEPVGSIPNVDAIPPEKLGPALAQLRRSLGTILSCHYFITKDLRSDLNGSSLGGTIPILYVFLARLGCTIQEVTPLNQPAPGVRIAFRSPGGGTQTLYYFRTNLANGASSAFLNWCARQGTGVSLVKSASYLMHTDGFSQCRRFLLDHSRLLVQDDSGIPMRAFDSRWKLRYFGQYAAPGDTFARYYQPDLAQAFRTGPTFPLGFGFGYHWQTERGILMLATRNE